MSIKPKCDRCKTELSKPGGLAFSPPTQIDSASNVLKLHLCADCWELFMRWIRFPNASKDSKDSTTDRRPTPCSLCGLPVEPQRECYATPTCYAWLPPPPPLPIAQTDATCQKERCPPLVSDDPWMWMMAYCKRKGMSPTLGWVEAERAWLEALKANEKVKA